MNWRKISLWEFFEAVKNNEVRAEDEKKIEEVIQFARFPMKL